MPQIFRIGSWVIYFWSNEGVPLEPIHVHIAEGIPTENATKLWLTQKGKCLLCNNNSYVPDRKLRTITKLIEARSEEIQEKWLSFFGTVQYYC